MVKNLIEIIKTKSDLMNQIRSMLKAYDVEWENKEISDLVDNNAEGIKHILSDALGDEIRKIADKYKDSKKEKIENEKLKKEGKVKVIIDESAIVKDEEGNLKTIGEVIKDKEE